ncbi:MAG: RICIN domain-containing protein [Verrucomicrobiota bacterium JB023]|nr:RICIN domain-containing protein [Verrucomicrobiota bacterium JB023]
MKTMNPSRAKPLARFLSLSLLLTGGALSQTTVNSLQALMPYLDDNNANIKLAPGTYTIDAADVAAGDFGNPLLPFSGNNSTFDFTGVTLRIDTDVFTAFGNVGVNEIWITGNNNILKNLTMVDDGSVDDRPQRTALNLLMDGESNRVEGFHMTVKGSFPYAYGDAFGKGSGYVIKHFKHSACLIRGNSNHLKDCTIIHRAYGHGIFMQGANDALIEGCYVEGEMRSTDDMLAETSGPAYDVNFGTVWGYPLPPGYMMSLQEDGIRTYTRGTTLINGVWIENRNTADITVRDCTVKYMRSGLSLTLGSGFKEAEDCIVIGCENGYGLRGGSIVNCSGDATYGPVYSNAYDTDNNLNVDITVLPAIDPYYNGSQSVAYIGGRDHNITLRGLEAVVDQNLEVQIGGPRNFVRTMDSGYVATDIEINNLTAYPLVLGSSSSGCTGESAGNITDNGSNNSVVKINGNFGSFTPDPNKTYYIDNPHHNLRLAATGSSEDAYTTSTSTTGADVEWKFVDKGNGYWHLDRAAGGSTPRLRTDNSSNADMQSTSYSGSYTYYAFSPGVNTNTFFLTLPDAPANHRRLQIDSSGQVKMVPDSYDGTWESFTITEVSPPLVTMRKRNASGYGIDGNNGGSDGQNVYLWSHDPNNVNQQWEEIDRGGGYFSYQKRNTNFSLDGGNGGGNGQNLYLWTTSDNNYNQHWRKVHVSGSLYLLQKRNATGYSIDGGAGGASGQNVYLWSTNTGNRNQQWIIE